MPDGDEDGMSARDLESDPRQLVERAMAVKMIATSANVIPHTIAAGHRNRARACSI